MASQKINFKQAMDLPMREMPENLIPLATVIHQGAKNVADTVGFRTNKIDLPQAFNASPIGKLQSQFTSFRFLQTKFVKDTIIRDLKLYQNGKGLSLFLQGLVAAVGFGYIGTLLASLRKGRLPEEDEWAIVNHLVDVETMGIMAELWRTKNLYGTQLPYANGPSFSEASDFVKGLLILPSDPRQAVRLNARRIPFAGPAIAEHLKPRRSSSLRKRERR